MGKNSLRKKIMLKGITTTPDDYLCEDGELAGAMGVESTDGGMEAVGQHGPKVVMKMENDTEQVIFEHKVKPKYNWIIWDRESQMVGYVEDNTGTTDEAQTVISIDNEVTSESMPSVEAIGNTLIIRCSKDGSNVMHYVLWKPGEESYKYLGTHIPELSLQFGLGLDYVFDWKELEDWATKYPGPYHLTGLPDALTLPNFTISDNNKPAITAAVMATINKGQYNAMKEGYFTQPFLVRYALKMYDGTTTMCSAPVYMPVTEVNQNVSFPLCVIDRQEERELYYHSEHVRSKLRYRVLDASEEIEKLKDWKDIIRGVEICVSAPLYTYNPSGEIEKTLGEGTTNQGDPKWAANIIDIAGSHHIRAYGAIDGENARDPGSFTDPDFQKEYRKKYIGHERYPIISKMTWGGVYLTADSTFLNENSWWNTASNEYDDDSMHYSIVAGNPRKIFILPEKSKNDFEREVRECSRFYKVASIQIEKLKSKEDFINEEGEDVLEDVEIDKGILNNITVQPQLEDEYRSHDAIVGAVMKTYNARLNLANVTRKLWTGFNPECWMMYYNERLERGNQSLKMAIETDRGSVIESQEVSIPYGRENILPYLYYPNTDAIKIYVQMGNRKNSFEMEEHAGLNGAVFFTSDMNSIKEWNDEGIVLPTAEKTLEEYEENKVYTSEAENPWRFLPTNVNTVSSGKILGMGAVTTALSQGQHGSFPMYCFTNEGIWSLSVNSTGGWATSQTVTRDVMREGTPILLIDDAIIFMSEQGLMMLQGDRTQSMTESQRGKPTISISTMPGLCNLIRKKTLTDFSDLTGTSPTDEKINDVLTSDLLKYLKGDVTDLYYDYTNQRVIIGCYGKDTKPYSWIYYLNRRMFTLAPWKLMNRVNSYPECYAMMEDAEGKNYMVRLDTSERDWNEDEELNENDVMMLTRPIKLGEGADMQKELENVTVEGMFNKQKLGMAVWGTRDYKHWHLVGSCKGLHMVRKHGSGYRAFVVAILGKLGEGDYLDSLTMEYQPRYVRKLHGMGYSE